MCPDGPVCTDTHLLPPQNLQNSSSPAQFPGRFGACGSIALNLPAPTALLWFNFVAKAKPQDKLRHITWGCSAPLTTPSSPVGSKRDRPAVPHPKHPWERAWKPVQAFVGADTLRSRLFLTGSIGTV